MMVLGHAHRTASTSSESVQNPSLPSHPPPEPSLPPRHPSASSTPTRSMVPASSSNLYQASSHDVQPTPPTVAPHLQTGLNIQVQEAPPNPQLHRGEYGHDENPAPAREAPPPSPRLEPTYRSTLSLNGSASTSPSRIKVRDLNHIQSFASEEVLTRSRHPSRHSLKGKIGGGQQYEISAMPVQDIIEMVAGLLTKITTTNDRQHEHLHRHIPAPDGTSGLSQQATSVLAFHGKNVPSITIASYLSRIHKYCPTTYEVFLSLLVYFDRMTEMVNAHALSSLSEDDQQTGSTRREPSRTDSNDSSATARNSSSPAPSSRPGTSDSQSQSTSGPSAGIPPSLSEADAYDISHYFVVDSFNIHRLVMAGVTCASKFFSDVFYTNSRYAKVRKADLPFLVSS